MLNWIIKRIIQTLAINTLKRKVKEWWKNRKDKD